MQWEDAFSLLSKDKLEWLDKVGIDKHLSCKGKMEIWGVGKKTRNLLFFLVLAWMKNLHVWNCSLSQDIWIMLKEKTVHSLQ